MNRRRLLTILMAVITVPLLVGPLVIPVEKVAYHNTRSSATLSSEPVNETIVQSRGRIVEYENLSDRAQYLYKKTLKHGGKYTVPAGEGAPEFDYLTASKAQQMDRQVALNKAHIVVKRPVNSDLPPPDEQSNSTRYDLMTIGKEKPDFPSEQYMPHVVLAIAGLSGLCLTGYLHFSDPAVP